MLNVGDLELVFIPGYKKKLYTRNKSGDLCDNRVLFVVQTPNSEAANLESALASSEAATDIIMLGRVRSLSCVRLPSVAPLLHTSASCKHDMLPRGCHASWWPCRHSQCLTRFSVGIVKKNASPGPRLPHPQVSRLNKGRHLVLGCHRWVHCAPAEDVHGDSGVALGAH